jgi:hypothetical protein
MNPLERRKFPRIDIDLVTVEVYESNQFNAETHIAEICSVENISEEGLLFTGEHLFLTSQVLRLTFLLPESIVIIRTDAVVAHVGKIGSKLYSTGVQFQKLGEMERKQIRHFINKIIVEQSI